MRLAESQGLRGRRAGIRGSWRNAGTAVWEQVPARLGRRLELGVAGGELDLALRPHSAPLGSGKSDTSCERMQREKATA